MDVMQEVDVSASAFMTYEDYLDSMLTKDDLMFLEDKEMCRELLVLGFHSNKRIISKEAFDRKKAEREKETNEMKSKEPRICGQEIEISGKLMQELSKREEDNITGCKATIIFIRNINEKGEEVSAYIDFAHRLKIENWKSYFSGLELVVPKPTDLSYYNWSREVSHHTSSPHFDVIPDSHSLKLMFVCRSDGSAIDVNMKAESSSENAFRLDVNDENYMQTVIFDHVVDRPIP